MANVNISVRNGSLTIVPWKVEIGNGVDRKITWNLATGEGGWKFSTNPPGIVCEPPPPPPPRTPPYDPWDGTVAASGPGLNQYNATGVSTAKPKLYKYSIHLVNDSHQTIDIDPEIMNDP